MNKNECIDILKRHNEWRRDDSDVPIKPTNSKKLGEAIDFAVNYLNNEKPI